MKLLISALVLTTVAVSQGATLFDNGAFQTDTGNGFGGGNTSVLTAPDGTFGFGTGFGAGNYVADNFTLSENSTLSDLTVFAYQTGASTATITGGTFAIYASAPVDLTTSTLAGNLNSTAAATAVFTDVYRVNVGAQTDASRRIQAVTIDLGALELAAGDYFVAWSLVGSSSFTGPFSVPVTPSDALANGLQRLNNQSFAPVVDGGSGVAKDFAFQINGTANVVPEPATLAALGLGAAALLRRRKRA